MAQDGGAGSGELEITRPRPTEKYWSDYEDWQVRLSQTPAAQRNHTTLLPRTTTLSLSLSFFSTFLPSPRFFLAKREKKMFVFKNRKVFWFFLVFLALLYCYSSTVPVPGCLYS